MATEDKPLVWLEGEVKSPPFSDEGRRKAGWLLRRLQRGEVLTLPESRPLPILGARCHELRIFDGKAGKTWRVIYRVDRDAIVIAEVFAKKTQKCPPKVIDDAGRRLRSYDEALKG